mmetsp:Transcript_2725/g.6186  ORF Transcript_2725/g.6186 Transcript_2725/m.6186 type:complete len:269 (-) Transcript_2725:197-1003(-)
MTRIDFVKYSMQVTKPEQVQEQRVEFFLLHIIPFSIAIQLGGLLVSPANGILVVDPLWPQAGLDHVHNKAVDFRQADDAVSIFVKLLPQRLQAVGIHQPEVLQILLHLVPEQNKLVLRRLRRYAFDISIFPPLTILTTANPRTRTLGGISIAIVRNKGIASSAVIDLLADDPSRLAGMEQIHWRGRPCPPAWLVLVQHLQGLKSVVYEFILARAAKDGYRLPAAVHGARGRPRARRGTWGLCSGHRTSGRLLRAGPRCRRPIRGGRCV